MSTPDPRLAGRLRDDLAAAWLTTDGLAARLGPVAADALGRDEPVPTQVVLADDTDPLATLVRCFLLGRPVPVGDLAAALPATGVAAAAAGGLVTVRGDLARALVDVAPQQVDDPVPADLWFASDPSELATGAPLAADHVLGVGEASLSLLRATVPPTGRVLDLGTGCGVQAVHAARRGAAVVATDVSARALRFAAFNAALAGVPLDLRLGSLLEPVAGERFDLVVSNPPFVITPRDGRPVVEYRDGRMAGDALVAGLVREVGAVLAPGGVAQLLGNWEIGPDGEWAARPAGWLEASGLDGWVVQRDQVDPAQYAELWLRDGGLTRDRDPQAWADRYRAWLADFAARGVTAIGMGLVVLRRPRTGGPTLRRCEELTGPIHGPLGPGIAATLAVHDVLAGLDDAGLAAQRLVVAPDVTEERHLVPGEADPRVVLLRQGGGWGRTVQVGTAVAGLVGACDGELSVGSVLGALGVLLERPVESLAADVLPVVRDLLRDGFLTVA